MLAPDEGVYARCPALIIPAAAVGARAQRLDLLDVECQQPEAEACGACGRQVGLLLSLRALSLQQLIIPRAYGGVDGGRVRT